MKKQDGFTLIEIVMVMAVIALIVGGIIATRSLIRTSQIQSVASEQQQYVQAIQGFKEKYHALPGDFAGATTLWGSATCTNGVGAATSTETCNGNGNGYIDMSSPYEHIAAWRHLGLSGLNPTNYSGNAISGGSCAMDVRGGENVPQSKLKGALWNLGVNTLGTDYSTGVNAAEFFPINAAIDPVSVHALWLGGGFQDDNATTASCAMSQIPVFSGIEAFEVDSKFDDAAITTGRIRGQFNNLGTYSNCYGGTIATGFYNSSTSNLNCALAFIIEP